MIAHERLLDVFVEVADTLVDDYDAIDFLHRLADNVVTVTGASAVGLLLGDQNDELRFMASSSDSVRHLELFQLQTAEGPCLDCYRLGQPVIVDDLSRAGGRWPRFAPQAVSQGFVSVHAFPMRLRSRVIGALNVFGLQKLPLQAEDVKVIQALADVATISLLQEQSIAEAEQLTEQLQQALNSRIVIEQAKGVVARSNGTGVDEAFVLLRDHARRHGLRLTALARAVVERSVDPTALGERRTPGSS